MATSRYRPNGVSVFHRDQHQPEIPGDQKVRAAFEAKDTVALQAALTEYPGAWQTDLCQNRSNSTGHDGPCAHFAIRTGWGAALPILHAAGDPLTGRHPYSGYTPMQEAVRKGQPSIVRKLLKMGVPLGSEEDISPLRALMGSRSKPAAQMKTAKLLLDAGADPWAMAEVDRKIVPLPIGFMNWSNIDLAIHLAKQGIAPLFLDDGSLVEAWQSCLGNHPIGKHLELFDALHEKGWTPELAALAGLLEKAKTSVSVYSSKTEVEADVVIALVKRRLEAGVGIEEMHSAIPLLAGHERAASVLALIEQSLLDKTVPASAPARRTRRF